MCVHTKVFKGMESVLIKRDSYLDELKRKRNNGLIKIITGVRRSGKSFLLFKIFYEYLLNDGISKDHIIILELDREQNMKFRNPIELGKHLRERIIDDERYYILLDEVQFVISVPNPAFLNSGLEKNEIPKISLFDVLNDIMHLNTDIYITGSNSRMLSKDLVTEARGRDDQIFVMPLSFKEFYEHVGGDREKVWNDYLLFGGMPKILEFESNEDKIKYLKRLFSETYIKDILARYRIENEEVISDLINIVCSAAGSLTSINKLVNTFSSKANIKISHSTMQKYVDYLVDAMIFEKAVQYNIKGRKYIDSTCKYYVVDVGLRNAKLDYRQVEETHLMENIIYNELIHRGYLVDVGVYDMFSKDENNKTIRQSFEIDFIANKDNEKVYIQSAYMLPTKEKIEQESRALVKIADNFKKIIIERNTLLSGFYDEKGIMHLSLLDFLLGDSL